jgi:hypothetical protein
MFAQLYHIPLNSLEPLRSHATVGSSVSTHQQLGYFFCVTSADAAMNFNNIILS